MKKILLINPLTYIILVGIIALCYQLFNGATIAYFNFNENINKIQDVPPSQRKLSTHMSGGHKEYNRKDCYEHGGCLNIVNIKSDLNILFILELSGRLILSTFLVLIAFFGGKYLWLSSLGWILGYIVLESIRGWNWFGSCYNNFGGCSGDAITNLLSNISIVLFILAICVNRLWLKKYII